jgi:hypothetical protein
MDGFVVSYYGDRCVSSRTDTSHVVHEVSMRDKQWIEIVSSLESPRPKGF